MMQFRCKCGKLLQAKEEYAGRVTRCPECQSEIPIPGPSEEFEPARRPRSTPSPRREDARAREGWDEDESEEKPKRRRRKGTSGKAIASLILGLASFLFCLLTGIPALILGFLGLRDINDSRGRLGGRGLAISGMIAAGLGSLAMCGVGGVGGYFKIQGSADKIKCANNLKRIGLALHNYHDTYGRLPPAAVRSKDGKPLYSWRVALLPFLEQDSLYKTFNLNEPWDGPHNQPLLARMPKVYDDPGDPSKDGTTTFYQVLVGPQAFFENRNGPTLMEITDGNANTIMLVEAAEAVPWTKPADLNYDPNGPLPRFGGHHSGGFWVVFGDGSFRFLSNHTDEATLRALITRNGGEVINPGLLD
jgi:hypothetical protein